MYIQVQTPGENIPIFVEQFPVEESVPTEEDIEWAVWMLRSNRSGGPSCMRAEHLRGWLEEAQKAEAEVEAAAETTGETDEGTVLGR